MAKRKAKAQTSAVAVCDLEKIQLKHGSHSNRESGVCAMEAVAWLAGEPHSDSPKCACPVITRLVIRCNDRWSDEDRNAFLKPLLPKILNTRSTPEVEEKRRWIAIDWSIRSALSPLLKEFGQTEELARIEAIAPVTDAATLEVARTELRAVCQKLWDKYYKIGGGYSASYWLRMARSAADAAAAAAAAADAAAAAADADAADAADAAAAAAEIAKEAFQGLSTATTTQTRKDAIAKLERLSVEFKEKAQRRRALAKTIRASLIACIERMCEAK